MPVVVAVAKVRAGIRPVGNQVVAHHIVAFGAKRAAPAKAVMEKFGIDINDEINGIFIGKFGGHSNEYYDTVNRIMLQATSKDEARALLQQIGNDIRSGAIKP